MKKAEYEMRSKPPSRGGSLFAKHPQQQLLNAIRTKDLTAFRRVINSSDVDPNHCYDYPDYKTCLDIAASDIGRHDFARILLQKGANVNKVNDVHKRAPIHFAAENGDVEMIKVLLDADDVNVNILHKGNTALHLAIKHLEDIDDDREEAILKYNKVLELLLKAGTDVNIPDLKGCTAIYSAAKQGIESFVKLIVDYSDKPIDLDTYKDRRQKSARNMIEQSFPHLLHRMDIKEEANNIIDSNILFTHLSRHEEDTFITDFNKLLQKKNHKGVMSENNGMFTLLQMASEKGMDTVTKLLLENGADPNLTAPGNNTKPVYLACINGFYKILKQFVDTEATSFEPCDGDTLLHVVIREAKKGKEHEKCNYNECIKIILKEPRINPNINYCDIKDNTPLHYAARNGDQETVLTLLKNGACIGIRNKFNEPPLADISAKTMEAFLDDCLKTNGERPSDDDFEIQFNYSFLVPPKNNSHNEYSKMPLINDDDSRFEANDNILAPETDALLYMTQNEELKPLLKHPVITSFLYLKWHRISCLFYANLTFYSLFWLALILYILLGYGGPIQKKDYVEVIVQISWVIAIIGVLILIIREIFQLAVSPKRYLKSFENWLEIALIIVTAIILFNSTVEEHTKQQLSPIAILLSSAELVLLIGQFPSLSTNIVMLRTVSWNFFKFLLWYCILIIAFALSFYTLFRTEEETDMEKTPFDPNNEVKGNGEEEDEDFFVDPGKSLFKTIVMLTGEFDAGSIKFGHFPVTSHIIFIVFVFMIPIVLFNLLNGLAVSDTQAIKADAELVGYVSRIQLISYFESIFLGDTQTYKNVVISMQNACCWLPGHNCATSRLICIKPLARRICLFPSFLPKSQVNIKPNQNCRIEIPTAERVKKQIESEYDAESTMCCLQRCNEILMDKKVTKAAKTVIMEKDDEDNLQKLNTRLANCETKISSVEKSLSELVLLLKTNK